PPPGVAGCGWSGGARSGALWSRKCGEAGERAGQFYAPGPMFGDPDEQFALSAGDPGGDVEQPVAQRLRLALGQIAGQYGGLGPGDQVGRGQGELEPGGVDREHPGREPADAGVLCAADPVLDSGVGAVPGLQMGELPGGG